MLVHDESAAVHLLQRQAIKPTAQRVEIALLLLQEHQHLSAEQVLDRLRRRGKAVSKATVYNTLRLFAARGIVQQVIVDPERVFYDSNTSAHFHFYNVDQGALIDVDPDAVHIPKLPALPYGTVQEAVDVIVRIRDK
ncbi:MAG: transcriptional repressor [Pseudomonadota bacterium]|nr:transcriptional repressor [Pseudomonadota bacterium]